MSSSLSKVVITKNIAAICAAARAVAAVDPSASKIRVEYSGSGDEGGISGVSVVQEDGFTPCYTHNDAILAAQCEITTQTVEVKHLDGGQFESRVIEEQEVMAVDEACEDIVGDLITLAGHDGYWNGDGGDGSVLFDLATGKLDSFNHTTFWTESETISSTADDLLGGQDNQADEQLATL